MTGDSSYSVHWRPLAEEDLLSIVRYIARDTPEQAIAFGREIKEKTDSLTSMPARCRRGHVPGTRELVVRGMYLVIFKIHRRKVTILRIKHAALEDVDLYQAVTKLPPKKE